MGELSFKVQDKISGRKASSFEKYREMVIGRPGFMFFLKFELIMLFFSRLPGALGLFLRSKTYPLILGSVGRGVVFGANITFRHPHKIHIGARSIIDDNVMLDAKGNTNRGIEISEDCFVGRNSILSCKNGDIVLKERANVGFNAEIFSSKVVIIGRDNLISAYTYVVGGGNYDLNRTDVTINRSLNEDRARGVRLDDNIWIGTHSVLLDGVSIGEGSAVAAGSVVNGTIPAFVVVGGTPARVIKERPRHPA